MNSFKLFNTKSFVETNDIELKPITIFVGRNSCGKSSLIRFPAVISQTFQSEVYAPLLLFGNLIDYGSFDDVVHNHEGDNIRFQIGFDKKELRMTMFSSFYYRNVSRETYREFFKSIEEIYIDITIMKHNRKIVVSSFEILVNDIKWISINRTENNRYNLKMYYCFWKNKFIELEDAIKVSPFVSFQAFVPDIEVEIDAYKKLIKNIYSRYSDDGNIEDKLLNDILEAIKSREYENISDILKKEYLRNSKADNSKCLEYIEMTVSNINMYNLILKTLNSTLSSFSRRLTYIGPFRKNPERIYRESENNYMDVGKTGENATMLLRQAQQSDSELLGKVSQWFNKAMGYNINIEEINNSNLFKVVVSKGENAKGDNIIDVGYGISQVLPIVTQIYFDDTQNEERRNYYKYLKKTVFVIEQPELHLHPAAQAKLADLFVDKISMNKENRLYRDQNKLLIETHSEHLIRRLQVLVADPDNAITANDIAIYYVEKSNDGESNIEKMDIDDNGQFKKRWPAGFFDKSYELSMQLLMANKKKEQ